MIETAKSYSDWCALNRRPNLVRPTYWGDDYLRQWGDQSYIKDDIIHSARGKTLGRVIWALHGKLCISSKRSKEEAIIKAEALRWHGMARCYKRLEQGCKFLADEFVRITGGTDKRLLVQTTLGDGKRQSWIVYSLVRGHDNNYYTSSSNETAQANEPMLITLGRCSDIHPEGDSYRRLYESIQRKHEAIWRRLRRLNDTLALLLKLHTKPQGGFNRNTIEFHINGRVYTLGLKETNAVNNEYWPHPHHIRIVMDGTTRTPIMEYAPTTKQRIQKPRRAARSK